MERTRGMCGVESLFATVGLRKKIHKRFMPTTPRLSSAQCRRYQLEHHRIQYKRIILD